jgi:putative ubiquitin-RnfH superfamily antitoxin RatB of RatAB toxin-antitoxin module
MPTMLRVEVIYALRNRQVLLAFEVEEETTVKEAIESSGILRRFPEVDLIRMPVGIFGRATRLDAHLRDGDRIEIYRPLIADPKQARQARVKRGATTRRGR